MKPTIAVCAGWFAGCVLLGLACLGTAAETPADPRTAVLGVWWTPRHDGKVEFVERDGALTGYLIAVRSDLAAGLDARNADPNQRSRRLLGCALFAGFHWDADASRWLGGTAYDPDSGKTYSAKLWCASSSELRMRGFIGFSLLGRTEAFERVAGPDPRQDAAGEKAMAYAQVGATRAGPEK